MRIITGSLRGRAIPFNPKKYGNARATSGMVKEAVFSILGSDLTGLRFLDLFAGTGQIGLEAFSRGASVTLVEPNRRRRRLIADLLRAWGLEDRVRLFAQPAETLISRLDAEGAAFDILYLDPPYHAQLGGAPFARAILERIGNTALVAPAGIVLVQHPPRVDLPPAVRNLARLRLRTYGDTALAIYKAGGCNGIP